MKCPKCQINHKKSAGMKCSCGYRFALDPAVHGMADGKLLALVRRASSNDTVYFTRNQLVTANSKIDKSSAITCLLIGVILIALGLTFCLKIFPAQIFALIVGVLLVFSGIHSLFYSRPNREKLFLALDTYKSQHGSPEKLIEAPELDSPPDNNFESDLFDYGVERILVVQRKLLVDLLVKNKVHVQNRALIVTADGYPKYLADTLQRLLTETPDLPVFFFHDSDSAGINWVQQNLESSRFNNGRRKLIDMGFSPNDLQNLKRLKGLRLESQDYQAPADVVPMAMLSNGIILSLESELGLTEIMARNIDADSPSSFG